MGLQSAELLKNLVGYWPMMAKTMGGSDTMYNILQAMGQDAEFLCDTVNKYTEDALKTNDQELVNR